MKIEKILEYQALDTEIKKLEAHLNSNPDQKALETLQKIGKKTQAISASLEKEAEKTMQEFNKMQKNYHDAETTLKRLDQSQEQDFSEVQCAEYVRQLNNIASYLTNLEKLMRQTAEKVNAILTDYEAAKKDHIEAKKKHALHKAKVQSLQEKIAPQIEQLQKSLAELEKGLNDAFLKKYKAKRQDKIFPIVVPLRGNACGGCGMELPSAQIEKLKKEGFLECENERCHRIIFYNNKK